MDLELIKEVSRMKNKMLISLFVVILTVSVLFLGATITGLVVQKVEYNDLCRQDSDCQDMQCCLIHPDKDVGICMEECESFEFLCKSDDECEISTVCCRPEGKDYGICNYEERCLDVDIFAEYVGKVSFVEPELMKGIPALEKPMEIKSDNYMTVSSIIIILLLVVIIWLLIRQDKKKR